MKKYPCLIQKKYCKTPVHVELEQEGADNDGNAVRGVIIDTCCNYQDKARTVLTAEKKLVEITGTALFPGDICPGFPVISGGTADVMGVKRRILQGKKARNPDGSVNYTEVLLV